MIKRIAVFCGSSTGFDKVYQEEAFLLGEILATRSIGLVYGGGNVGLMKAVADGALNNGGDVIGVLPGFLEARELGHPDITEMVRVDTMHERKMKMNDLSDGVITLPGGFGTMEEFFEMLTWGQLGLHTKPLAILNTNGFYNPLVNLSTKMVEDGFLKQSNKDRLIINTDINSLLDAMINYIAPRDEKWITRETT